MFQTGFSKILIIVIVGAVIVAGGILVWQQLQAPKEEAEEPAVEAGTPVAGEEEVPALEEGPTDETAKVSREPEQVVSEFYQCYLQARNQGKVGISARKECSNDLEESYRQEVTEEKLRLVDPILWAQDVPPTNNLQVGEATIEGKAASVIVSFPPIWPDHKLKVSLSLIGSEWKISNIEDMSKLPTVEESELLEEEEPTDEITRAIGYIKTVYEKDGKRYLDIDYVQWLTGDEAIEAMREDGKCPIDIYPDPSYCIPNGYYIRNQNPKIRTFEISEDVQISRTSAFDYSPSGIKPISYEEFKNLFTARPYFSNIPFNIEITNGVVVKITEQFIP